MSEAVKFGDWLKTQLKEKNVSQAELARWLNTAQESVSRWINKGILPRKETVREIKILLGEMDEETEKYDIYEAFRHCITYGKCKGCPRQIDCSFNGNSVVTIPKSLALDVNNLIIDSLNESKPLTLRNDGYYVCPKCKNVVSSGSNYCSLCGQKLIGC